MEEISGATVPLKRGLIAPYFRSTVNYQEKTGG